LRTHDTALRLRLTVGRDVAAPLFGQKPGLGKAIENLPQKTSKKCGEKRIFATPAQTGGQASGLKGARSDSSSSFDLFEVAAPAVCRNYAFEERALPRRFSRSVFVELALAAALLDRVSWVLDFVHIDRIQTKAHRFRIGIGLFHGFR